MILLAENHKSQTPGKYSQPAGTFAPFAAISRPSAEGVLVRRKKSFGPAGSIARALADTNEEISTPHGPQPFQSLGSAANEVVGALTRRDKLPQRRGSDTFETWFEGQQFIVTFARFENGELAEVFINAIKTTTLFDHLARDTGLLLSLALQHGARADRLGATVSRDSEGRPQGLAGHILDIIRSAP